MKQTTMLQKSRSIEGQLSNILSKENEDIRKISKPEVNCTQLLNVTKPTLNVIFRHYTSDITYNSNKTENVTVVFVRGDTVKEVLNFGTNSNQMIEIQCLSPDGM